MDEEKKENLLSPLEDGLNELGDEVEEKATELLDALHLPHNGEQRKTRKAFEKGDGED